MQKLRHCHHMYTINTEPTETVITLPARALAKYCDEHVYLSVCLSVCPRSFTNFFVRVAYSRGSVLIRRGDEIPREMDSFGRFLTVTMHCNAFAANGIGREGQCAARAKCNLLLPCFSCYGRPM